MKYKLLVLDVDDTLLGNDHVISKRTKATLLKVQQMGIHIVLATGRPSYGVRPVAEELELSNYGGYVMSYNGGEITEMQTGKIIFEKCIDPTMIPALVKRAEKNTFPIFTYEGDEIITTDPSNEHIRNEAMLNNMKLTGVDDFSAAVKSKSHKCVMVSDDTQALLSLEKRMGRQLNGVLDVFSSEDFFLEIVPRFINKGNTLAVLLDIVNIKPEEVMAIGNGVCDIPMLQLAGTGIAMGNAAQAVKRCTDRVTLSNDEDGVAVAVEQDIIEEIRTSEIPLNELNARAGNTLMGNLGIQYTYASLGRVEATMPVDVRTRQPFGILHGGASLALAETVAGFGSMILCQPDEVVVGMQVSGNHMSAAYEGDTVRAIGTVIHKGRSTHVWDVNIYTSTDKLVSSVRVVNNVLKKK
jgi:Cof subfamily protein (haloacid dehalogenase superfamily)